MLSEFHFITAVAVVVFVVAVVVVDVVIFVVACNNFKRGPYLVVEHQLHMLPIHSRSPPSNRDTQAHCLVSITMTLAPIVVWCVHVRWPPLT